MAHITKEDIFGADDSESAPVPIPAHVAVNSSPSCSEDESKSSGKRAGKAPSRERLSMQQKLKAIQHFEKNRMNQTELANWMFKNLKLTKVPSKAAVSKMLRKEEFNRIKAFAADTNHFMLQKNSTKPSQFPQLEDKLFACFRRIETVPRHLNWRIFSVFHLSNGQRNQ